jgi:hypothetical protein
MKADMENRGFEPLASAVRSQRGTTPLIPRMAVF